MKEGFWKSVFMAPNLSLLEYALLLTSFFLCVQLLCSFPSVIGTDGLTESQAEQHLLSILGENMSSAGVAMRYLILCFSCALLSVFVRIFDCFHMLKDFNETLEESVLDNQQLVPQFISNSPLAEFDWSRNSEHNDLIE